MLMSDGFGRLKRWDLNHFNDDSHAEEVFAWTVLTLVTESLLGSMV